MLDVLTESFGTPVMNGVCATIAALLAIIVVFFGSENEREDIDS